MALDKLPDFSFQGQVPTAAIIAAYQQKAQQEEQMRMNNEALKQQKVQNVKDVFTQGAGLVGKIMEFNKQKQMSDAQQALTDLLASGADQVPTNTTQNAKSSLFPQLTQAPITQNYSATPEYKAELASLVTKAFPAAADDQIAKAAFAQLNPQAVAPRTGQMKMLNVILPGKKDGTFINYDTFNRRAYDLQGNDVTDQVQGAIPGFAPATVTTNQGATMIPRVAGSYSATSEAAPSTGAENINQLPPKHLDILEKTKEDFNQNPAVKTIITKLNDLESVNSIIDTETWVADAALLSNAAKGIGRDAGALNEQDVARYGASPELLRRVKTKWSKWTQGVIPEADRKDFRQIVQVLKAKNEFLLQANVNRYANTARKRVPNLDPNFAKEYLYDTNLNSDSGNDLGDGFSFVVR